MTKNPHAILKKLRASAIGHDLRDLVPVEKCLIKISNAHSLATLEPHHLWLSEYEQE